MSRTSEDVYVNGQLVNGFDYTRQAWVIDGFYVRCGHPDSMNCRCYGREHEGEPSQETIADTLGAESLQSACGKLGL